MPKKIKLHGSKTCPDQNLDILMVLDRYMVPAPQWRLAAPDAILQGFNPSWILKLKPASKPWKTLDVSRRVQPLGLSDYPSTLLSFWGFSNLFRPCFSNSLFGAFSPAFGQRPCGDFTKIGGSRTWISQFHGIWIDEQRENPSGRATKSNTFGATAFGWLGLASDHLRSSPIISDPNMNWWAALRICDCFEAGVCSFRFMMKQYQAPDVLIRSIQFSEFHCDHESKVYFGPAKNAAIHLRLGLNFDPYPMWGCPKNEAHPMQMGSSWFIITLQTKSPNYDKLDEPIRYIVLLWYNLWL